MSKLHENIRKLRLMHGMSQEELAKLTGFTDRSSIAKIEKGDVDLTEPKIITFAKALRVTPQELVGWDPIEYPDGINPLLITDANDVKLLYAYHSAPDSIQSAVRKLLDLV